MEKKADIALIGLAVMGQNLVLNMNDHGFTVVVYNRSTDKVDNFLANEAKGTKVLGAHSIEEMVAKLKTPRRVMMLVKAGKPVDDFIEQLIPYLEPGDIIIDGGNSLFEDTNRRQKYVESKGLLYIGTGVSGGEEGARLMQRPQPLAGEQPHERVVRQVGRAVRIAQTAAQPRLQPHMVVEVQAFDARQGQVVAHESAPPSRAALGDVR